MSRRVGDGSRTPRSRRGPLAGIRVADFCWVGVGALATRVLADYGAEVIKIEDDQQIDLVRRLPIYKSGGARTYGDEDASPDPNKGGLFNNYSRNKLGVTINMRTGQGRALAEKLIATSDIVTENYTPGVLERWGLTPARIRELRADVIFARMTGYGQQGPNSHYRSYGPIVQAVSGLSHISGLPGEEPSGWGFSYMDMQAAYSNSMAILMAIYRRNETGQGTDIDTSAIETGIGLLGPVILDVGVNNRTTRRPDFPPGNMLEHPAVAPHGVYPCQGEDRWIAIAVLSDEEWQRLAATMGHPPWATEFAHAEDRHRDHRTLDAHLAEWTRGHDAHELMHKLQAAGVRAAAAQNASDILDRDPQIQSRSVFFEMDHPVIGPARFESAPLFGTAVEPDHWRSAPLLGEDNAHVFKEILGLSDAEYRALLDAGAISDPPLAVTA